jgi:hypothetical protein
VLESNVHWEACINEGAPNAILSDYHLVGLKMVADNKSPLAVLVDIGNNVITQHPTILLRRHAVWLLGWLIRPPDCIPDVVEVVA